VLDRIVANKQIEVAAAKMYNPLIDLKAKARDTAPARDFRAALRGQGVSLIAEVKRASPSRGALSQAEPLDLASIYARNGAAAISVLTDEQFFHGQRRFLTAIRAGLGDTCPPLLRKDFMLDPYQIWEARADGADAVLLIVAILMDSRLRLMLDLATDLGMAALVEVHNEEELARARSAGATVIGINNRNLNDFTVDLTTTERLLPQIPADVTVVSESGIRSPADIQRLAGWGAHAALVGEALVTAPDIGAQVTAFVQAGREC
jgi:indole-3-glycerol phosphate synthase